MCEQSWNNLSRLLPWRKVGVHKKSREIKSVSPPPSALGLRRAVVVAACAVVNRIYGWPNERSAPVRRLRRSEVMSFLSAYPSTIVAMEACATAHFWGARDRFPWARDPPDRSAVCACLRQDQQKRCSRRRGDLRSSIVTDDAIRRSKVTRSASDANATPRSRSPDQTAHDAGERLGRAPR